MSFLELDLHPAFNNDVPHIPCRILREVSSIILKSLEKFTARFGLDIEFFRKNRPSFTLQAWDFSGSPIKVGFN